MRKAGVVTYLFGDHLGSTSVAYDDSTNGIQRQGYTAFGSERYSLGGDLPTQYQYTGQRGFEEIGLYFYNARWYDSYLNRFLSPDTIVPEATQGVQAWDRYSYTNNNPLRYNDPSGHFINVATSAILGGIVGVGLYALNVARSQQDFSFAQAATVAAVGAASGALISTGVGAVAGVQLFAGIGMATSAGGHLIANAVTKSEFETPDFLITSAYGYTNGALGPFLGTTVTSAMALGAGTNILSYTVTQAVNNEPITGKNIILSGGIGAIGGFIGGAYPRIDNGVFVKDAQDYLLRQGLGSFARGLLAGVFTNTIAKPVMASSSPSSALTSYTSNTSYVYQNGSQNIAIAY